MFQFESGDDVGGVGAILWRGSANVNQALNNRSHWPFNSIKSSANIVVVSDAKSPDISIILASTNVAMPARKMRIGRAEVGML